MSAKARWVGAIVGLLVGNIAATGVLIAESHHGASKVIPAYYEQAVHYDDVIAQAARDTALGWRVEVAIAGDVIVRVYDRNGAPIDDARVRVTGYARAAGPPIDVKLASVGGGIYRAAAAHGLGWHDLKLTVERGQQTYVASAATEAR